MEGYLIGFLIIVGLLLGAYRKKENMTTCFETNTDGTTTPTTATTKPVTTSTAVATVSAVPLSGFDRAVKAYRDNYVSFKVTGKPEYKTAYTAAQGEIEKYIAESETKIKGDADYVSKFVRQYADSSQTLQGYKSKAQTIRTAGPRTQDEYTAEKKRHETPEKDMQPVYIKLVVAGLIAGVGVVALLLR